MRWSASLKGHPWGEGGSVGTLENEEQWALDLAQNVLEFPGKACCVFSGLWRRLLALLIHISAPLSRPALAPHHGAGSLGPGPRASGRNLVLHHGPSHLGSFVQGPTPFIQEKPALPPTPSGSISPKPTFGNVILVVLRTVSQIL